MFEAFGNDVIVKVKEIREEFDELDEKKKRPRNQLLMLDDITAYLKDNNKPLIELATNRRHLNYLLFCLYNFYELSQDRYDFR